MNIAPGFLLATVPFGADLVQLLVVPASACEAPNVIETALPVVAGCQRLDAQIKGHYPARAFFGILCHLIDKGGVIVAAGVSTDRHLLVAGRNALREFGPNGGIGLVLPALSSASGQQHRLAFDAHIHRWIAQGEELMAWTHSGKAGLFTIGYPFEEGLHGLIQSEVDFGQELAVHLIDRWIKLPALRQRF